MATDLDRLKANIAKAKVEIAKAEEQIAKVKNEVVEVERSIREIKKGREWSVLSDGDKEIVTTLQRKAANLQEEKTILRKKENTLREKENIFLKQLSSLNTTAGTASSIFFALSYLHFLSIRNTS